MRRAEPITSHHLYVHVPFCRLVCAYCDFVTVGGRAHDIPRYVDALVAELALRPPDGELRTIYFGGGTPSLLPAVEVARIVDAARARWAGAAPAEVTLEANPSARETPDWSALRAAGITRLSLGVQSLRDEELRALTRGHTAGEARAAFSAARAGGFDNISIDLIYGVPGQSLAIWGETLEAAIHLAPEHLSLYALSLAIEPDVWAAPPRPGALRWRRRLAAEQDDGEAVAQYRLAERRLAAADYDHYELSSWARPGRESRHNAAYWARRPYTGLGAGAHSFDGATRSWNLRDLDGYMTAVSSGELAVEGSETLDEPTREWEAIALGLRRIIGLSRAELRAEFGSDPLQRHAAAFETAQRAGLVELDGDTIRLSPAGRVVANEVLIALLPEGQRAAGSISTTQ
ncbi:MAG: radical SAM family heme chaperone HemW [Chloroflexota bacterium]